ncbi:outer membrane lipoprotein carrier protein LolA [bacterium]|nr:outer membrane lipoprotein carrier protein LolA [bacterium]
MKIRIRRRLLAVATIIGVGAVFSLPVHGADKKAREIIGNVRKTVENLTTLSCSFDQEYVWKETGRARTISGTLRVKEPNRLRVEYAAQAIVVDGKQVWWYIAKNNQVTIQNFEEGDDMFPTPYGIFRKYIAGENASGKAALEGTESVGGRPCLRIHLGSNPETQADITVWIDNEFKFPLKSVEKLSNGDVMTYVLKELKLNVPIADSVFTYEIPDGVDVVDMRQ